MGNRDNSCLEYKRRMCLAMDFIVKHLEENPTLEEIAEAAYFSKYHFHRLFHAVVGETVAGFVRRIKLEKSANVLIYGQSHDITSVAHICGFSSSQNFAKAFRTHFGVTPTEFRHQRGKRETAISKDGNA